MLLFTCWEKKKGLKMQTWIWKRRSKPTLSMCLDLRHVYCVCVFFFFTRFALGYETIITVHVLQWYCSHCSNTVHGTYNHFIQKKILKMGLTVLFTHLKIILLQYFQFSIFNFNKNKLYLNGALTMSQIVAMAALLT